MSSYDLRLMILSIDIDIAVNDGLAVTELVKERENDNWLFVCLPVQQRESSFCFCKCWLRRVRCFTRQNIKIRPSISVEK
jgi:hypothetical protein